MQPARTRGHRTRGERRLAAAAAGCRSAATSPLFPKTGRFEHRACSGSFFSIPFCHKSNTHVATRGCEVTRKEIRLLLRPRFFNSTYHDDCLWREFGKIRIERRSSRLTDYDGNVTTVITMVSFLNSVVIGRVT